MNKNFLLSALVLCLISGKMMAQENQKQQLVNSIKSKLAFSKDNLKKYSWIETTTVFYKGEQKSVKVYQCYYDVGGGLQKVETAGGTAAAPPRGLRGRVAENKTDDITAYLKKADALIKTYLPPDPEKLQQIQAAGTSTVGVLVPNKQYKISFPNYNLPGDQLSISINTATQSLMSTAVASYINSAGDVVTFNLTYSALPDGTQYASETDLVATAENVKIVIVNTGYTLGKQ
jgi:hypothetical protein